MPSAQPVSDPLRPADPIRHINAIATAAVVACASTRKLGPPRTSSLQRPMGFVKQFRSVSAIAFASGRCMRNAAHAQIQAATRQETVRKGDQRCSAKQAVISCRKQSDGISNARCGLITINIPKRQRPARPDRVGCQIMPARISWAVRIPFWPWMIFTTITGAPRTAAVPSRPKWSEKKPEQPQRAKLMPVKTTTATDTEAPAADWRAASSVDNTRPAAGSVWYIACRRAWAPDRRRPRSPASIRWAAVQTPKVMTNRMRRVCRVRQTT